MMLVGEPPCNKSVGLEWCLFVCGVHDGHCNACQTVGSSAPGAHCVGEIAYEGLAKIYTSSSTIMRLWCRTVL
jgi:hypothetical protein